MARSLAELIRDAAGELRAADAALSRARSALDVAARDLSRARIDAQPPPAAPVTDHRREHRPGRPAKLDTDAELRSFVLARIDRMTFEEIAAEIAVEFPVKRRLAKSAIHTWWRKNRAPRNYSSGPAAE